MQPRQKLLMGLLLTPLLAVNAQAKGRANHDAFLVSPPNQSLSVAAESLQARGVQAAHMEERLGVPTFLWAQGGGVSSAQVKPGMTLEQAARTHLQAYADAYRLSASDLGSNVELKAVHQTKFGPIIAQFVQRVDGIEVFRNELKVIMRREDLALVAISGYLAPGESVRQARAQAGAFKLSAEQVVARAFQDLTGLALSPRSLVASGKPEGGYTHFALETGTSNLLTWSLGDPPRAKPVYYTLQDRLEPAWYVEVEAGPKSSTETSYFSYVFSASSGALLMRNDLTAHSDYTYRVWADPTTKVPYDGPHGTEVTPHPTGVPDNYNPPYVPSNLVTLSSYPFSMNDPWLPAGATETQGNNADAYADLFAPDGYQEGRDFRATTTSSDTFDYTYDPTRAPGFSTAQQQAAVVNLFYMNNFLHDWYYDAGFDEVSGNAQASNYGRGGLGGDALRVEGQDYGGRNNANMSTPADGARPRMQMYIFNGRPRATLNSPPELAGDVPAGSASFGAAQFTVTADVLILDPAGTTLGCTAFPAGTFTGKIALIDRGTCNFIAKAKNAQAAGAVAVIIANNAANQPPPGMSGTDATITVPTISITLEAANAWKARVAGGATINMSLARTPDQDTDGTLDNDIIAHEWGHYISNRLIANSSGLVNNQGRAMGEGWADFHSLLLSVRESDRMLPGNAQYQGVYPTAVYTQNGATVNGSYFGIRRVPYSTDTARNALTLRHTSLGAALPTTHPINTGAPTGTSNSQVHASGEVWATMLWECYASLLNAYPFQDAQDRMKHYLVAAYKATPASPTYLEARDAVLAVAAASDPADYQRFLQAFAKRGAGLGAKVSDRNTTDHVGVVESYAAIKNLEVVSATLDDGASGCDRDGVLDVGEQGFFTLTVRNTSQMALSGLTGEVTTTSTTATLAFPSGTTLTFPTIQPNATARVRLPVRLTAVSNQPARAGLRVTFNDTDLPTAAQVFNHDAQVHYDDALAVSASDNAEGLSAWTSSFYQSRPAWSAQGTASNRYYHADNPAALADLAFTTPWLRVNPAGNFTLSFVHRYSFEASNGSSMPFYDGGVIEFSLDGIVWYDVLDLYPVVDPGYNYTNALEPGSNPLAERYAYVGLSPGFPNFTTRTLNFRNLFAGMEVRFRFRVGADESAGAYGWDIDNVTFTNVANTPFGARVAETSDGTTCNTRPVANAGSSQVVLERIGNTPTTVTLNGTGSFDAEGQALTYVWTQTGGPPVALRNDTSALAQFEADVPYDTSLTFQLVVSDGVDSSVPATVTVSVANVNRAPTAVATGPASADEGSVVTLSGTDSSDEDNEDLTYAWTQTGGPTVTLTGADTDTPSFTTPAVSTNGENVRLTFSLVVRDIYDEASAPTTLTLQINNVDQNPTANAGEDLEAGERSNVLLRGTGSDPDRDTLTYAWRQTSGPAVTLSGADTATASFTAPDVPSSTPEVLTFELTVTANGRQATDAITVTVRNRNRRPVARGPNTLSENERNRITLSAAESMDPDGDALSFLWVQTGGPTVPIEGAGTEAISFIAPEVQSDTLFTFRVTVTDPGNVSSDATVNLTVRNVDRTPVANAGSDQGVEARSTVTLAGSGSDPDGDGITYSWSQVGGTTVTLTDANTATPSFTAPDVRSATPEVLTFELTVAAGGLSSSDTVAVSVRKANRRPVAQGPNAMTEGERTRVTLSAAGSLDPDGDALSFEWTQTGGPLVTLEGASTEAITFTTPEVQGDTLLTFRVVATDPDSASGEATVNLTVRNVDRAPVANAGTDKDAEARSSVVLMGSGSDPDGDTIAYSWRQVSGTVVTLTGANTATASFTAPDVRSANPDVLTFELTATANGATATDTVVVTVRKANRRPVAQGPNAMTENERNRITLSAAGSLDPDGDALSFQWTQTGGPLVTLEGASTEAITFTTPEVQGDTLLTFRVVATDPDSASGEATVSLTVRNVDRAPVANAGADKDAEARSSVVLMGSGSDPDGDIVTYAWRQVGGTSVTLTGANTATASFTAPDVRSANPEALTFELTATANGATATDTVVITVRKANRRPVAQGPNAMQENERTSITLTASGLDDDGDVLNFQWTQTGGPVVQFQGAGSSSITFTTPEVLADTLLAFRVVVTDADGASSEATVSLTVKNVNRAPAASPRKVAGSLEGETITLDANASDADGDTLTYAWRQTEGPPAALAANNSAIITFEAPATDENVELTFEVTVTDGKGGSDTKTVKVTVLPDATTPPGGGGGNGGGNGGGGGCASTGNSGAASMAPLLLLALGLLVSRRRLSL